MNSVVIMAIVIMALLFFKIPVFASVLGGCAVYFFLEPSVAGQIFAQRFMVAGESVAMLAIPFFTCAGIFMNYSGVTKRIMDFCAVATGNSIGGLAKVNVLLSTLMGGLSGSNLADAAMEAKMLVPEMEKHGYSKAFSTVVTACSAVITPLIPPGIAMIIYGTSANMSIAKLFIAGIGPGIALCIAMMLMCHYISKKRGYLPMRDTKPTRHEWFTATKAAIFPLCLPIIIIGGIRLGIFTPTEAGAISIIYTLVLSLVYKEFSTGVVKQVLHETVESTAKIMLIICAANVLTYILTSERIPQTITEYVVSTIDNKWVFLLIVNVLLLVVGMLIEGSAAMVILVPLLHPVALAYGFDPIHFAMVFIFNMALGCLTPPMGTLMFVTCGITKCRVKDFVKECMPFYGLFLVVLAILCFIPTVSTFFVELMY